MRAKDKFLEKINILILIISLCFTNSLSAKNIYDKIFDYNGNLLNSSVNFIQTNLNDIQEGVIFFGEKRIKIEYTKPQKITIIVSPKKGIYTNHELEESQFFATKNSYIKFLFNIFYDAKYLKNASVRKSNSIIEISEEVNLENIDYKIILEYENEPIKLRLLKIINNDDRIQMGFFNHNIEQNFKKDFFSMVDPYLD